MDIDIVTMLAEGDKRTVSNVDKVVKADLDKLLEEALLTGTPAIRARARELLNDQHT